MLVAACSIIVYIDYDYNSEEEYSILFSEKLLQVMRFVLFIDLFVIFVCVIYLSIEWLFKRIKRFFSKNKYYENSLSFDRETHGAAMLAAKIEIQERRIEEKIEVERPKLMGLRYKHNKMIDRLNPFPTFCRQIFIKLNCKTLTLDVELSDTIFSLKKKIYDKEGIGVAHQRMVYSGKDLENERTLYDYNINKEATIELLPRLTFHVEEYIDMWKNDESHALSVIMDGERMRVNNQR